MESYPLKWPDNWKRTRRPERSRFNTTFGNARDGLMLELERMGARHIVLSTNIPLRRDGLPYANHGPVDDDGVAIYFEYKKNQMVFACDRWSAAVDNIQSIRKTIEAIRGIERWGASDMMERAFGGFAALPAPKEDQEWWEVLEIPPEASPTRIKLAYYHLARKYHPDNGTEPDAKMMEKVNLAFEKSKED